MRPAEKDGTRTLLSTLVWYPVDAKIAEEAAALGRNWLPSHHGASAPLRPRWGDLCRPSRQMPQVSLSVHCRTVTAMSKTERIEVRVSADDKDAITAAAAMEHTTTTEFVRGAVLGRVQRVRARADRTLMPADQFDVLVAALDVADNTPNLARAFANTRRFVQR